MTLFARRVLTVPVYVQDYINKYHPWPPTDCPAALAKLVLARLNTPDWKLPRRSRDNLGVIKINSFPFYQR